MIISKKLLILVTISQMLIAEEAHILTTFTVGPLNSVGSNQIQLGQFFTPNHHAYPLDPSPLKMNQVRRPIFSGIEAIGILTNAPVFRQNAFVTLNYTITPHPKESELLFSVKDEKNDSFTLISKEGNLRTIEAKIYLIDTSLAAKDQTLLEVIPGKQFLLREIQGKTLFLYVADTFGNDLRNYTIPLEVRYDSP